MHKVTWLFITATCSCKYKQSPAKRLPQKFCVKKEKMEDVLFIPLFVLHRCFRCKVEDCCSPNRAAFQVGLSCFSTKDHLCIPRAISEGGLYQPVLGSSDTMLEDKLPFSQILAPAGLMDTVSTLSAVLMLLALEN